MSDKNPAAANLRGTITYSGTDQLPNSDVKVQSISLRTTDGKGGDVVVRIKAWGAMQTAAAAFSKDARVQLAGELRRSDYPVDKDDKDGPKNTALEVHLNDDGECMIEAAAADDDVNQVVIAAGEVIWGDDKNATFDYKNAANEQKTAMRRDLFVATPVVNKEGETKKPSYPVSVIGVDAAKNVAVGAQVAIEGMLIPRAFEHDGKKRRDDRVTVAFNKDGFKVIEADSAAA